MKLIELSGAPKDRGLQHGAMLRDEIHALYAAFLDMIGADEPPFVALSEAEVLAYAAQHLPFIDAAAPDLLAEMHGIAEASGIAFEQILAMNCVAEIRRLRWPDVRARINAGPDTANGGCTCAVVQGDATGGDVLLTQTYDIEPIWTPILFRNAATETTPAALFVGHAGILCQFGMNAAGISVVASALRVDDQRPGVPAPIIARLILNETRLSSAVEAIVLNHRTVGIHYAVGSPTALSMWKAARAVTRSDTPMSRYILSRTI
ncbi:C45 family autoproteolytic acyltransferase/hydolase [Sulfitobacter aestuariivivens]|uniref:C45 family autoproteolytic acyltransferase/hydolase n=1 Tax=Sulfitobacter aestuariivivens TaxID=2766981 RepID=UPI00360FD239